MKIQINPNTPAVVAVGKTKGNKYISVSINDKVEIVTFPNSIAVLSGQPIYGNLEIAQKHYDTDAEGKALPKPFDRWEVVSYTSMATRLKVQTEINQLKKLNAEAANLDKELQKTYDLTDAQVVALAEF